jgi:hypothetical protein
MQTDLGWLVERIIEKAKETMKKNAPESAAHLRAKFEYALAFYASAGRVKENWSELRYIYTRAKAAANREGVAFSPVRSFENQK